MNTSAKYQANSTEIVVGVVRTRFCVQTDRPTDRLIPVYPPPKKTLLWGIKTIHKFGSLFLKLSKMTNLRLFQT